LFWTLAFNKFLLQGLLALPVISKKKKNWHADAPPADVGNLYAHDKDQIK